MKNQLISFYLFFIFLINIHIFPCEQEQDRINENHVIFSYEVMPKTQPELDRLNELVHTATYELKQYFKKNHAQSEHSQEQSQCYPQHRNSVFVIHFDHTFGSWTLYKPSFVSYENFIKQAKKIYKKYGVNVQCQKEETVNILQNEPSFDSRHLTLDELETYKKMNDHDFDIKIKKATLNNLISEVNNIKSTQMMKKYFFWHLQIPTSGLLPGRNFDINDQYKPLAWNFLLWDLAPKKGEGAQVAIIDTGVSAFNVKEEHLKKKYKKNINIYAPCNLQNYGYNLVSEDGLDPIRQVAIKFGHYCDHVKFDSDELIKQLPEWIKNFIESGDKLQFEQYFIKNTKNSSLDKSKTKLNKMGEWELNDLLYGKYGINPKKLKSFFNIVNLDNPYNQNILLETLPAPSLIGNDSDAAGHGTFTQGIVSAQMYNGKGITGLAPNAKVIMIKAFHDRGTTNKTTLNGALERALALKSSIVSMSLKITDTIDEVKDATLKKLIDSIDYVIAASGNDGTSPELHNKEAFPAKFDSVAFDVGSFQCDQNNYTISSFTQRESNIGPKFVAPGYNIFSAGLTDGQTTDSMYVFMTGTSVAVPIVTGFVALAVAEFQDVFTREEILKTIYKFSIKLNNDQHWQQDIILGTIDMRSCLFCLRALQAVEIEFKKHPELHYNFNDHFDNIIQAIYIINYYIPSCYEKEFACSLMNDFTHFNQKAHEQKYINKNINFFTPFKYRSAQTNLKSAINFTTQMILQALNQANTKNINKELQEEISKILLIKNFNLFAQLPKAWQNRIGSALAPKQKYCLPLE